MLRPPRAWEEINDSQYDPALGRFVKQTPKEEILKSPSKSSSKRKSVAEPEKKIAELEEHVKKAEKHAERSERGLEYLDKEFSVATVQKFKDRKEGLAEWMLTSLDMVTTALENVFSDEEPSFRARDVWALVVRAHAKYERKHMSDKKPKEKERSGKTKSRRSRSRSRSRSRGRGRSSHHRRGSWSRSRSLRSDGDLSDGEVFYRGKWKFQIIDGVEYVITKNKRWRTDRAPPGDCDHCGGCHREWLCPRKGRN